MARDEALITQTVRDYFEGWYDADVGRTDRAWHSDLVKRSPADDGGAILTRDLMLQACAEDQGTRAAGGWKIADALWLPQ